MWMQRLGGDQSLGTGRLLVMDKEGGEREVSVGERIIL